MLRFDRYLVTRARTLDLASGHRVRLKKTRSPRIDTRDRSAPQKRCLAVFESRAGETLIDVDIDGEQRIEVWERWTSGVTPNAASGLVVNFDELLESARLGAPRAFDLPPLRPRQHAYVRRVLAREARIRGWVPIALD